MDEPRRAIARAAQALAAADAAIQHARRGRPTGAKNIPPPPIADLAHEPRPFLTVALLAEYWACHPTTILDWIRRGDLAAIRVGRAFRIRPADALHMEARLFAPRSA